LQRRKTRTTRRDLGAALAAALCLAGCGSGTERNAAPQPRLPRQLAATLAAQSDAVAGALDAGDSCRALQFAESLRQETIAAINAGRVPAPLLETLQDRVNDLPSRIECVPPATDDEQAQDGKDGKGEGKGKKKKHRKGHD
jgi:hypothetical protein